MIVFRTTSILTCSAFSNQLFTVNVLRQQQKHNSVAINRDVVCSGFHMWCTPPQSTHLLWITQQSSPPLDLKCQIMLFHYITQVVDITKRARNSLLPAFWKVSQMPSVCGLSLNEVNHRTLQHLCSAAFCFASSEKDDYQSRANVKTNALLWRDVWR